MNRGELLEIKKRFKIKDCSFKSYAYAVVEENKEINIISEKFLTLPDMVQKKYLSLISKAYSGAGGAFADDIDIDGDDKKLYTAVSRGDYFDEGLVKSMVQRIIENYEREAPYALILFLDTYDVPNKDTSKTKTGESDEIYSYVAGCICPFKPSGGGIMLTDGGRLEAADVFRMLSNPVMGFIYPSFNDRQSDNEHMFVSAKDDMERNLVNAIYKADVPMFEKPVKENKKEKVEDKDSDISFEESKEDSYIEYEQAHISMSYDTDTSIKQNAPKSKEMISLDENMHTKVYESPFALTNKEESGNNDCIADDGGKKSSVLGSEDIVSVPTDKIIERNVNGTRFFMVPENLISYDKLMLLIEEETKNL